MPHDAASSPAQTLPAYAGIGSRATPAAVLDLMTRAASWLSAQGWVLRTGMATGADQAFYRGASARGALELYLPWPSFEASARPASCGAGQLVLGEATPAAYELAATFHPRLVSAHAGRPRTARTQLSSGAGRRPAEPGTLRFVLDA
jgi:hypothetical protein